MVESSGILTPRTDFVHLHVHTDASLKDGLGTVDRLVNEAAARGYKALAMTDHGSLANAIVFSRTCEEYGIRPIIGLEAYVATHEKVGHMTLLADGDVGFENLVELNNIGHAGSFKQPAFGIDDLENYSEGLYLLSGCVSSPLNQISEDDALRLGARLKLIFGKRFLIEVMFVSDTDTWSRSLWLAENLKCPMVITNDVHFPFQSDAKLHSILTKMKAGFSYNSAELWLKSPLEIGRRAIKEMGVAAFEKAIRNTAAVANAISPVNLKCEMSLPSIPGAEMFLRDAARKKLDMHWTDGKEYHVRFEKEFDVIRRQGYLPYFYILKDIVDFAKANDVTVGPGRGSGAGSLLLYTLGITKVDPIRYGLKFERFLNEKREGLPDVDIDFESKRRQLVLDYAASRWNATAIATYAKYSHKILVHDLCKLLRVPRNLEKEAADMGVDSKAFVKICDDFPSFGLAYEAFSGQIRHKGRHAGGVIITDGVVPIERAGNNLVAAWVEGARADLSYAGLVKFDLLGLSALDVLGNLHRSHSRVIGHVSIDDRYTFDLFCKGNLSGIFQFSGSPGIRDLTMRLQPKEFEDLVAINALYRPGALDAGVVEKYPDWKETPREVPAKIADILAPTYGAIIYQEQVMEIFARITGGDFASADLARRIMLKVKAKDAKWDEKMRKLKSYFMQKVVDADDITVEEGAMLWREMITHTRYSFNRSHAVAYSMIALEMAFWKSHYPEEFYTAILNAEPENAQEYIFAAVRDGIEIRPPHVNRPQTEWKSLDKGAIAIPLSAIKYLGEKGSEAIVEEWVTNGYFANIEDFMNRISKSKVRAQARIGLYAADAFRDLYGELSDLVLSDKLLAQWNELKTTEEKQQTYLNFIILTRPLLDWVDKEVKIGRVAGIVTKKAQKESKWGAYTVYYLAPDSVFWTRNKLDLKAGDLITASVNKKNGKMMKFKRLDYDHPKE